MPEGLEERRSGRVGWCVRLVMAAGWVGVRSGRRWMLRTVGGSLRLVLFVEIGLRVRDVEERRREERSAAEGVSESESEEREEAESAERRRFFCGG